MDEGREKTVRAEAAELRDRPLRVLHLPANQASQLTYLVEGLRECGVQASGILEAESHLHGDAGEFVRTFPRASNAEPRLQAMAANASLSARVAWQIARSDVIHWHARWALRDMADMRLAKALGKVNLIHYHGTDIRRYETTNPYLKAVHDDPDNPYRMSDKVVQRQSAIGRFVDNALYAPDLAGDILPGVYQHALSLPGVVNARALEPRYPSDAGGGCVIVHGASSTVKGTDAVREALASLAGEYDFRAELVAGAPRSELLELMGEADIYLDAFVVGSYGIAAIEAMALGKPVVSYISDNSVKLIPDDCPVIPATQETLADVIRGLLDDPSRRRAVGLAGRRYVEKYHDNVVVARRLAGVYRDLQDGNEIRADVLWQGSLGRSG